MLMATMQGAMGDHIHADSLRPDRIIKTGVIEPYPLQQFNPLEVARRILLPFASMDPSTVGPQVPTDPTPESVVEIANTYANAMRQGIRPPNWLPRPVMQAITALVRGVPFTVTSQGRTLLVKPSTEEQTTVNGFRDALPDEAVQSVSLQHLQHQRLLTQATIPGRRQARERQTYYHVPRPGL